MSVPKFVICFDVESVGLHGEGYAVGWVVLSHGAEIDSGYSACPSTSASGDSEDRRWIEENVDSHLPAPTRGMPIAVRRDFWDVWLQWRSRGAILVADCAWPVEARFLAACADDDPVCRRWEGPYPLHDVATARLVAGLDPLATVDRLPTEMPAHHPTADARQSARLFMEAQDKISAPMTTHQDQGRSTMLTTEQLDNWTNYHPPTEETAPKYAVIRNIEQQVHDMISSLRNDPENAAGWGYANVNAVCRAFIEIIDEHCPDSADKSAAIRCVRLVRNALNEYLSATNAPLDVAGVLDIATGQARMALLACHRAIACGGK